MENLLPLVSTVVTREIEVQTDCEWNTFDEEPQTILFCSQVTQNEASTQTIIVMKNPLLSKMVTVPTPISCKSTAVNTHAEMSSFGFTDFRDISNDAIMKQLGGVTILFFLILFQSITMNREDRPNFIRKMNNENRLLLFLMKMKLGLDFSALSCIFRISRTTASTIFYHTLNVVFKNANSWIFWPSKDAIKATMPSCFKNYPNCRAIIDCSKLYCDTPQTVEQRAMMYFSYKSGFTIKYLIAVAPSGFITFVSKGFGGRTSDEIVTNSSGFLSLIEPGDEIMADKGFPQIKSELLKRQSLLIMLPFALNP